MKLNGRKISTVKGVLSLFHYHFCGILGAGKFGVCYLVSQNERFFVLKVFNQNDVKRRKVKLSNEGKHLKSINHPAVPKLINMIDTDGIYGFVMEKMPGNSLEELIICDYDFSRKEIVSIMTQLIDVVNYLYLLEISHCDIKTSNILWDRKDLYLIDFGSATKLTHYKRRFDPDLWGIGDVFLRLSFSSQEMVLNHKLLNLECLNLNDAERNVINRLLHIEQPYHCIQNFKQDFERSFDC